MVFRNRLATGFAIFPTRLAALATLPLRRSDKSARYPHNIFVAISAPARIALNFSHTTVLCTSVR